MTQYLWQDREKREYVYAFNPRPECLAMIQRPPSVALDIGCGSGGVGHALRSQFPRSQLWGCEFNAQAAAHARQHFDQVIEQDVETVDFPALGLKQPFDLVCLFDVLEHLVNPWQLLKGLNRIMADDAHILVSLPNVSNLFLLYDALHGHWQYQNWGLLDFTHLRFFTDFDARSMFYQAGYRVIDHRTQILNAQGASIMERYKNTPFPFALTAGDITVNVSSPQHLAQLCADQNLYLITPHHHRNLSDEEQAFVTAKPPVIHAFGG